MRRNGTRRKAVAPVVLGAVLALGVTALPGAATIRIPPLPQLTFTAGGTVSPKTMPENDYVPVSARIFGNVQTSDGTHPSALREAVVDIDKDVKINARGYPSCGDAAQRDVRRNPGAVKKVCGKAILGSGEAHVEIAFPEQKPILARSPITVFNGGEKGGKVKLLIHVFITVPVPAAIVAEVTIQRKGGGVHVVAKAPVIAGGSGSVIDFDFKLGRTFTYKGKKVGYFEARCPDGKFNVTMPKILFENEARIPHVPASTILKDSLFVPCTPKG